MHSVEDLKDALGLTDSQVRTRLDALEGLDGDLLQKGKKNKKLLTDNGLVIMKRVRELEEQGLQIREAMKEVKEEIGEGDGLEKGKGKPNQSYSIPRQELPQTVERHIDFLEDQVQRKDEQIKNLQARLEKSMQITEKRIEGEAQSERWWEFWKSL